MIRTSLCFGIAAALSALSAPISCLAETPAAPSQPAAAPPSLQEEFDRATNAQVRGDCRTAIEIFARLAGNPRVKPGSIPAAAIAARRGECLVRSGSFAEGETSIQAGLPILQKAGEPYRGDVAASEYWLGEAAFARWDHDAALRHYRASLGMLSGEGRVPALIRLALATTFDGGSVSTDYADEAILLVSQKPKPNKTDLARLYSVRGRTLLNQGRVKEGYADLKKALAFRGGLDRSATLDEVAMRYDLAQAALLSQNREQARTYLAYTGAGRIAASPFSRAISMESPSCGPETGLAPADTAVVEFSIGDDGRVFGAQTVYSSGGFAKASMFARAVKDWAWDPQDLQKIPAFYRLLTRVEMRCSRNMGPTPGVTAPLYQRFGKWAAPLLAEIHLDEIGGSSQFEQLREIAARRERAGMKAGQVAALAVAAIFDPIASPKVLADLDKALVLAGEAGLPAHVANTLRIVRLATAKALARRARPRVRHDGMPAMLPLASDPSIAADPLARDTAVMLATPVSPGRSALAAAVADFRRVADDEELDAGHPLRQLALLRLANLAAAEGKLEEARRYFTRTGLTEQQCALIGVAPALKHTGADSSDYPLAAFMMGFEGWVKMEFDINADGTTADAHPLIAYPPFVFVEAATGMTKDVRYQASYRPEGGSACSAKNEVINFIIPSAH